MASCQVQKQNVSIRCKAYPGQALGIKDYGSVGLVHETQIWEKVPAPDSPNAAVKGKVKAVANAEPPEEIEAFVLVKEGMALAHGAAGAKLFLVPYSECGPLTPNMIWGESTSKEDFKRVCAGRDNSDAITHIYGNLDVNKNGKNTVVVVNAPIKEESQLWNISPHK